MDYREFGKTGFKASSIGMGTYYGVISSVFSGAVGHQRIGNDKVAALKKGIELGMNLIDTAEVYQTEELVAEAIHGEKRDGLFVATKVWPSHLHYDDVLRSATSSLSKLRLTYVDLYQIHWPNGKIPVKETIGPWRDWWTKGKSGPLE